MTAVPALTLESIRAEVLELKSLLTEQLTLERFPVEGFLRVKQILGDPKAEPPVLPIIPVSSSSWWDGVAKGRYPQPVRHGSTTMWRVSDIRKLIKDIEREQEKEIGEVPEESGERA